MKRIICSIFLLGLCACTYGQESRLIDTTIKSVSLQNAVLEVASEKQLVIYLPPSYHSSKKDYPVIYYLPGYTSPISELLEGYYEGFQLPKVLDSLIANHQLNEMIVVLCDGGNFLGGSFYVNSPLTGNYEDFITKEVVDYIDTNFRTIEAAASRGISGHSMGGFGAFNLGMRHPDLFGACYIMSPGMFNESGLYDFQMLNHSEGLASYKRFIEKWRSVKNDKKGLEEFKQKFNPYNNEEVLFYAFLSAYGAAFCHNVELDYPHIQVPDTVTTAYNLALPTFDCWKKGFGQIAQKIPKYKEQLLKLKHIALDCGYDDNWITNGTKYLGDQLVQEGIPVEIYWHKGGHNDQLHLRLEKHLFPYFSQKLSF